MMRNGLFVRPTKVASAATTYPNFADPPAVGSPGYTAPTTRPSLGVTAARPAASSPFATLKQAAPFGLGGMRGTPAVAGSRPAVAPSLNLSGGGPAMPTTPAPYRGADASPYGDQTGDGKGRSVGTGAAGIVGSPRGKSYTAQREAERAKFLRERAYRLAYPTRLF